MFFCHVAKGINTLYWNSYWFFIFVYFFFVYFILFFSSLFHLSIFYINGFLKIIVIGDDDPSHKIILNNNEIASSNEERRLGILLDSKLTLDSHITSLCKKAGQKPSALARINHYLTPHQKLLLLNSVVKSQFSYCPLIWMITSRYLNNGLNGIHERALRLIYNDYELSFDRICEEKNIESLAIETYKFQAGLTPPIMSDLFVTRENNYNLRHFQELESSHKRTVKFGTETISNRGPSIWNLILERLMALETPNKFYKKIKKWKCDACLCRVCKTYIQSVGFINSEQYCIFFRTPLL